MSLVTLLVTLVTESHDPLGRVWRGGTPFQRPAFERRLVVVDLGSPILELVFLNKSMKPLWL